MPNELAGAITGISDKRQRFLFDDFPIRGEIVQLEQALKDVFSNHQYPDAVKRVIGEFMAASALLSATIKFEGSLILQVKGNAQISTLMAECRNQSELRAIAQYKEDFDSDQALIGNGQMAITIQPDKGERYQGIVLVEDNGLASALENYFLQSEQLRTKIWLSASESSAAGMLIQSMPESASESSLTLESEDWNRISMLSDTLEKDELLNLEIAEILHRLFHEENLRLFETNHLSFKCSCSHERSANTLATLGETEARSILAEMDGPIEIDCQFCHAKYRFDESDINKIFGTQIH